MKKVLVFILVLICCFSLCACGDKKFENRESTTKNETSIFAKNAENDKYIEQLMDDFNGTWIVTGTYQPSMIDDVTTFSIMLDQKVPKEKTNEGEYKPTNTLYNVYVTPNPAGVVWYLNKYRHMGNINEAFLSPLSDSKIKIEKAGTEVIAGIACEKYLTTREEQKMNVLFCKDLRFVMKVWDDNLTYFEITDFIVEVGDVSVND